MQKIKFFAILLFCVLLGPSLSIAEDFPRFFGLYVMQNGEYVEITRTTEMETSKYKFAGMGGVDFNYKTTVNRDVFMEVNLEEFNKNGLLCKEDKNWTDFVIGRVPHTGKYANNENNSIVITSVSASTAFYGTRSAKILDPEMDPEWLTLRKAKVGEDVYIYIPSKPLRRGLYVVDYKKNGKGFKGWNAIELK